MNRITTRFPRPSFAWPLLMGALAMVATPSCDNPACVFGEGSCQVLPGGGVNALASTFPATGETVLPGGPRVTNVFPSGAAHPESPIVVVFSESVSPESVDGAFVLVSAGLGSTAQPQESLIGDGRVLILIPPPLVPGQTYELTYSEEGAIRDLSGAEAVLANGAVVGSFSVDAEPDDVPKVLMTWPFNGATNVSTITQVVTVFNRIVFIPSISGDSWELMINGADPTVDDLPSALVINTGIGSGGQAVPDSRVWMWESLDPVTDQRVTLGEIAVVDLQLSKEGSKIITPSGPGIESFEMATTDISFTTADLSAPRLASITSTPNDAFGILNLTMMNELEITVDLEVGTAEGDVLEIFLVGQNPDGTESGIPFISRQREVTLTLGTNSTFVREPEVQLVKTTAPLTAQFLDGDIGIGFALRRGEQRTAMRVVDVDLTTAGVQDARLDLQAPEFISLFGEDDEEVELFTDLLEFSVAGVASEKPNAVWVELEIGSITYDNKDAMGDPAPPVATSSSNGTFIARPVFPGQVGDHMPSVFRVTVYDRALNASEVVSFDYTQRGGSGPGTGPPAGADVNVVVYNAATLQPVSGALVISQGYDPGGAYDATFGAQTGVTNTFGYALMPTVGSGEPVFTVQANGYDLFTFQGVPNTRLEIPLTPIIVPANQLLVTAGLSSAGAALSSSFIHNFLADSRSILPGPTIEEADTSSYNSLLDETGCTFGDANVVRGTEIGLVTALSTKDPANLDLVAEFSPQTYLLAFELNYPRKPITEHPLVDGILITVDDFLSGAGVDPEDVPQGTAAQVFEEPINYATDFPNLVGTGPTVTVEALTYGLRGMMTMGLGLAYENVGRARWDIRSSYSAKGKAGGDFATDRMIEDERLLRVEIVDASGNRSGARQPMSAQTGTLTPPQVPGLITTVVNGPSYDLTCKNVLIDGGNPSAVAGLYRTLLVDSTGRQWHIWTLDAQDGVDITTHVPPIDLAAGGVGLTDGLITSYTDAWGWDGFDPENFLFSDIARRHIQFASSGALSFTQ